MKDKDKILAMGLDALDTVAKHIDGGASYSIKVSFKRYGFREKRATITFLNKTFSEVGENCIGRAIRSVLIYCIRTFENFADMREEVEKILEAEKHYCEPAKFEIVHFKIKSRWKTRTC